MEPLDQIKSQLKEALVLGIMDAIIDLKSRLSIFSANYNVLIGLEGRYQENHSKLLMGVIVDQDASLESNRIRVALLHLIDQLTFSDLGIIAAGSVVKQKFRKGSIFYRIPEIMQLGKEATCQIRIAFNKEDLDIEPIKEKEDVVKELRRMADTMSIELIDPSAEEVFTIRTPSSTVQFVEEGDYTEWVFYISPLKAGEYPIVLKVGVIELINDQEKRKDIILEERVKILSVEPEEKPLALVSKKIGDDLVLSHMENQNVIEERPLPRIDQNYYPTSGNRMTEGMSSGVSDLPANKAMIGSTLWSRTEELEVPSLALDLKMLNENNHQEIWDSIIEKTTRSMALILEKKHVEIFFQNNLNPVEKFIHSWFFQGMKRYAFENYKVLIFGFDQDNPEKFILEVEVGLFYAPEKHKIKVESVKDENKNPWIPRPKAPIIIIQKRIQ